MKRAANRLRLSATTLAMTTLIVALSSVSAGCGTSCSDQAGEAAAEAVRDRYGYFDLYNRDHAEVFDDIYYEQIENCRRSY